MKPIILAVDAVAVTAGAATIAGLTLPDWAAIAGIGAGLVSVVVNAPAAIANLRTCASRFLSPRSPR